jgi:hypothetical protein
MCSQLRQLPLLSKRPSVSSSFVLHLSLKKAVNDTVRCNHVEEVPISCAFHNGTGRLNLHLSQWKQCCASPLIQLHPTTIIPGSVLPHNGMSKLDLKSGFYYIPINLQYVIWAILPMSHQTFNGPPACSIYNLPDCSVSFLSAFQCPYGSLPSLLADLWTHHPRAWHFVVPSAAFTPALVLEYLGFHMDPRQG